MAIRGVNLGGWLVLERWITPSIFSGTDAIDETSLIFALGSQKTTVLSNHFKSWIQQTDLEWIAQHGLQAVRLPVPYWLFGDVEPYVASVQHVDWLMQQAEKYNLKVVLDLHTAPGSQNGYDHSGITGSIDWHRYPEHVERTKDVLVALAERYGRSPALMGLELLNEPSNRLPSRQLLSFYSTTQAALQPLIDPTVQIICSDAFKPANWSKRLQRLGSANLVMDMHLYQCFSRRDKKLSLTQHLANVQKNWQALITNSGLPTTIGEWSLALDSATYNGLSPEQTVQAKKDYYRTQQQVFDQANSWFYWTYKTEDHNDWNFRYCYETGLIKTSVD